MITFKEFQSIPFLNEALKVEKGVVKYVAQKSQHRGEDHEEGTIDTFIGNAPHKTDAADSGGIRIFSTFLYHSDAKGKSDITNLLKSIKGNGPYEMDSASYKALLNAAAGSAAQIIDSRNISTIVYPKSSSDFVADFIQVLKDKLGDKVNILPDVIVKKQIDQVSVDKGDVTELFNLDHPQFNTLDKASLKSLEKSLLTSIKDNQSAGKGNIVSMKGVSKRNAKFFSNFLELVTELSDQLDNKNVLIVDDVLSSGATFAEMVRLIKKENVKNVVGYTIFKNTATPKKKS